jgi:hypothetical protein
MEALVILSLFVALALLAGRFGHDSREHPASIEEGLARQGFAWHTDQP